MAHEISIVNGRAEMFSGNNVLPWHELGTIVQGLLSAKEAIEAAHLGWKAVAMPVTVAGKELSLDDYQGICREDTLDTLGIVKGRYEIIQNSECFSFMDSLVGDGEIRYETAGALRGGKQVWMLAKYNGEIVINKDQHRLWLLLVTSHDGSKCLECCWVTERVVCANTLSIALNGKSNSIKIRHSADWQAKRDEAKRVLGLTKEYFTEQSKALSTLGDKAVSLDQMVAFTEALIPCKDKDVPTRTKNIRSEIASLFTNGAGNHGQTRWDALNAVTDYVDHSATIRGQNTRMESALWGSGAQLKQRAYEILTDDQSMNLLAQSVAATKVNPLDQVLAVSQF